MLVHALAVPGDASDSSSVTIINTKRNELDTGIDKTWAIINEARITLIVVLGLSMAVHIGIHKEEKLESMFNSSSDTSYIFFIGAALVISLIVLGIIIIAKIRDSRSGEQREWDAFYTSY